MRIVCKTRRVMTAWLLAGVGWTAYGAEEAWVPPSLPGGQTIVSDTAPEFLVPPSNMVPAAGAAGYAIAQTPPTVDLLFFPGQDHRGEPWSCWGLSTFADGKYYCAIGDHRWTALVYEYDPEQKKIRTLVNLKEFFGLPEGHYMPGKVHSAVTMATNGWLYYATHNAGAARATEEYHYQGDWILRTDPKAGKTEIVCQAPIGKVSVPVGFTDPARLVFYGCSEQGLIFFAYDLEKRKPLFQSATNQGPSRCMLFSRTTGRVYYRAQGQAMYRYDPAKKKAKRIECPIDPRAATEESPDGKVYAVDWDGMLWQFDVKREKAEKLGAAQVGKFTYITTIAMDKAGRYLYYSAGAHGGAGEEGTPIVQFDTRARQKKVIAFLSPFHRNRYGYTGDGTYGMALAADDAVLFASWNGMRKPGSNSSTWDVCALTAIHIPASERAP